MPIDIASVNVNRLAGYGIFLGLLSICLLVFMPETDSLKYPESFSTILIIFSKQLSIRFFTTSFW
ncbi:TPA: hypothetical protein MIU58_16640 [Klebsiella pneumoniae]|nr:hypothetical protein [Klebsiella pneumoniae]HBY4284811.1 hypothetical protein [Klebsiella pneumoniae]HBY4516546.1 hypothetical protein [Klebsiella pneumoniae]